MGERACAKCRRERAGGARTCAALLGGGVVTRQGARPKASRGVVMGRGRGGGRGLQAVEWRSRVRDRAVAAVMARRFALFDLGGVLFEPGLQHFLGSCERRYALPRYGSASLCGLRLGVLRVARPLDSGAPLSQRHVETKRRCCVCGRRTRGVCGVSAINPTGRVGEGVECRMGVNPP